MVGGEPGQGGGGGGGGILSYTITDPISIEIVSGSPAGMGTVTLPNTINISHVISIEYAENGARQSLPYKSPMDNSFIEISLFDSNDVYAIVMLDSPASSTITRTLPANSITIFYI